MRGASFARRGEGRRGGEGGTTRRFARRAPRESGGAGAPPPPSCRLHKPSPPPRRVLPSSLPPWRTTSRGCQKWETSKAPRLTRARGAPDETSAVARGRSSEGEKESTREDSRAIRQRSRVRRLEFAAARTDQPQVILNVVATAGSRNRRSLARYWYSSVSKWRDDATLGAPVSVTMRMTRPFVTSSARALTQAPMSSALVRATSVRAPSLVALRPRPARSRASIARPAMASSSISSYLPSDTYNSLPKDGDLTFLHTMLRVRLLADRALSNARAPPSRARASPRSRR